MARDWLPEWAKAEHGGVALWLDDDNALVFIRWKDEAEPYMANWFHRASAKDKGWCMGGFAWRKPEGLDATWTPWTLESWEPLTVSPSLLCMGCGAHGFIREGKWVPA